MLSQNQCYLLSGAELTHYITPAATTTGTVTASTHVMITLDPVHRSIYRVNNNKLLEETTQHGTTYTCRLVAATV
jgi:hypothetical protein